MFDDFKVQHWITVACDAEHTTSPSDAMPSFIFGKFIVGVDAEDVNLSEFGRNDAGKYMRFAVYENLTDEDGFTDFGSLIDEFETLRELQSFLRKHGELL